MSKICEFSCFTRIEKNGIEIKNKQNSNSSYNKLTYYQLSNNVHKILIKNNKNEEIFQFEKKEIKQILDILIKDGKVTLIIDRKGETFNLFIFKTTHEILENFLKQIRKVEQQIKEEIKQKTNNLVVEIKNNDDRKSNLKQQKKDNGVNLSLANSNNLKMYQKRKFDELYKSTKIKETFEENELKTKKTKKPFAAMHFNDLSIDIHYQIRTYLSDKDLLSLSLCNKSHKNIYDLFRRNLSIKNETPAKVFKSLLQRFPALEYLSFGSGKYLKNEIFKFFEGNFKILKFLDLSEISNLNEKSLTKILSRTKPNILKKLLLNFENECLSGVLHYIEHFFQTLSDFQIVNRKKSKLSSINDSFQFSKGFTFFICKLISLKKFENLSLFYFNSFFINQNDKTKINFDFLSSLSITNLVIKDIKDLKFLINFPNLISLSINDLLYIQGFNLKQIDLNTFSNQITITDENQLSELNFDNDYIEIFINILSKLKKLQNLSLGSFTTNELVKVISVYSSKLCSLKLNSNLINDSALKEILLNLRSLEQLDLRGCLFIDGSCFLEVNDLPITLNSIKFSINNYNFYNLVEYLNKKGIKTENYLIKNN